MQISSIQFQTIAYVPINDFGKNSDKFSEIVIIDSLETMLKIFISLKRN